MPRRRLQLVPRKAGVLEPTTKSWDVRDAWIETTIGDGWMVAFRVFEQGGELVVGEIRVFPDEPDEGNPDAVAYYPTGERQAGSWSAENLGDRAHQQVPKGGLTARKLRDVRFEAVREAVRELLARVRIEEGEVEELFGPGGLLAERRLTPETYEGSRRVHTLTTTRSLPGSLMSTRASAEKGLASRSWRRRGPSATRRNTRSV